mmetsp:Transcript_14804/g.29707  ORF Transcript_14804/g.29707 Transcript_14804/m.29707 type:complete len:346 (-) Transcript_14804:6-1043(-)
MRALSFSFSFGSSLVTMFLTRSSCLRRSAMPRPRPSSRDRSPCCSFIAASSARMKRRRSTILSSGCMSDSSCCAPRTASSRACRLASVYSSASSAAACVRFSSGSRIASQTSASAARFSSTSSFIIACFTVCSRTISARIASIHWVDRVLCAAAKVCAASLSALVMSHRPWSSSIALFLAALRRSRSSRSCCTCASSSATPAPVSRHSSPAWMRASTEPAVKASAAMCSSRHSPLISSTRPPTAAWRSRLCCCCSAMRASSCSIRPSVRSDTTLRNLVWSAERAPSSSWSSAPSSPVLCVSTPTRSALRPSRSSRNALLAARTPRRLGAELSSLLRNDSTLHRPR